MRKINIHEAKTHLSKYAREVKAGKVILLCDRNVPFAEIRPLSPEMAASKQRAMGMDKGKIKLGDDWDSQETNEEVAQLFNLSK